MSIGYACLTNGVPHTEQKSCRLKNATEVKLLELIACNLKALENIIEYNIKNDIKLFRISSDLITFGSSSINELPWWDLFAAQFSRIGDKIRNSGMRVSMHPGQYTVLNSPDEGVVERAMKDLNYHTKVLDSLGVGPSHKIVLHVGGVYNDKKQAVLRFVNNYNKLDEKVKARLVVENDDKSFTVEDVLEISTSIKVPVIFDNLHHKINGCNQQESDYYWIGECKKTWQEKDGYQKIHYSQQNPLKQLGSHSQTIQVKQFMSFYDGLETKEIDIMLEVKDKNLSAVKCINCTTGSKNIKKLEHEWSKYKYTVLESSPSDYLEIRKLLRNKDDYPVLSFYHFIEQALQKECSVGNSVNAALHIWGYFKESVSDKEKSSFLKSVEAYKQGETSIRTIKNSLWKMAVKYQQLYLLDSYYFVL